MNVLVINSGSSSIKYSVFEMPEGRELAAGLVDEILCYMATDLLGSSARPFALLPLEQMSQRQHWQLHELRRCGEDLRLRLRCANTFGAEEH